MQALCDQKVIKDPGSQTLELSCNSESSEIIDNQLEIAHNLLLDKTYSLNQQISLPDRQRFLGNRLEPLLRKDA